MDKPKDSDGTIVDLNLWKESRNIQEEERPDWAVQSEDISSVMEFLESLRNLPREDFLELDSAFSNHDENITQEDLIRLSTVVGCLDDVLTSAFGCHAVIVNDEIWQRVASIRHHLTEIEKWTKERS